MTLTISSTTEAQALAHLPVASSLWRDSQASLPLAHLALAHVANLATQNHGFAVVRPIDLQQLPGYEFEQYCIEIKAFRFSDSLWQEAQQRYGVTFATQLCHMLGAFLPSADGQAAHDRFISARNQVLCQVRGATDC